MNRKKSTLIIGATILSTILTVNNTFAVSKKTFQCNELAPNKAKSIVFNQKTIKELDKLTTMDIAYYSHTGSSWKSRLRVSIVGDIKKSELEILPSTYPKKAEIIKYSLEVSEVRTDGIANFNGGSLIIINNLPIVSENETIKLTIEWGENKEIHESKNQITDEVISPQKALELFKAKYGKVKDISSIRFDDFRYKNWYISFYDIINRTDAGIEIDAFTGKFNYVTSKSF